jgi:hypothetical protein
MNYQLSIIHYQLLRNLTAAMFAGAIFVFLPGCPPATSSTTAPAQENPLTGPCADQLQDVLGQFLLYFKVYKDLPPQIQDLARVGTINVPLACPTTHAPYVYNPDGLTVPNWTGRLILYDSRPHGDFRRGILVERIKPGQPLVAHVIPISEKDFQAAKPVSDATSLPAIH